jgi:membrane complex biogenesis BtpA family protein
MFPAPGAKVLVGVIHLPALPGAPRFEGRMGAITESAARDAETLAKAGFDAVMVENFGDVPFYRDRVPSETVAAMAVIADGVRRSSRLPVGVNVLRNDGCSALSVAVATQASFVRVNVLVGARVTDQGVIESDAARLARHRVALGAQGIALVADVDVKHSAPLAPLLPEDEALEAHERAMADVLVVTGARTGSEADMAVLRAVRARLPSAPLWLGSGVRHDTLGKWLEVADGVIVGSALRADGRAGGAIDLERARSFVAAK